MRTLRWIMLGLGVAFGVTGLYLVAGAAILAATWLHHREGSQP